MYCSNVASTQSFYSNLDSEYLLAGLLTHNYPHYTLISKPLGLLPMECNVALSGITFCDVIAKLLDIRLYFLMGMLINYYALAVLLEAAISQLGFRIRHIKGASEGKVWTWMDWIVLGDRPGSTYFSQALRIEATLQGCILDRNLEIFGTRVWDLIWDLVSVGFQGLGSVLKPS